MSRPEPGKIYKFKCVGTSRYLNLHTTGATYNGINVCLWTEDGTPEQEWKYEGGVLKPMTNTAYSLDRLVNRGANSDNNADIWDPDLVNQRIRFDSLGGNRVRIKLSGDTLYLSAYNNANGTGTGKTKTSRGNVFFAPRRGAQYQEWEFEEVGGEDDNPSSGSSSGSGKGNGEIIPGERPENLDYNSYAYGSTFNRFHKDYEYRGHNLPAQCTWHCFGRAYEVLGKEIQFKGKGGLNGGAWWTRVIGYSKGQTPKANSIAVWIKLKQNGNEPDPSKGEEVEGHVAYVEKVVGDKIYLSEANFGLKKNLNVFDSTDGIVRVPTKEKMDKRCDYVGGKFTFKGYIYL